MYLHEFEKDTNVELTAQRANKSVKFNTRIIDIRGLHTYLEPVYAEEKIVGFSTSDELSVKIFAVNISEEKLYMFKGFQITACKLPDLGVCYDVLCLNPGTKANRREACRIWLGYDGITKETTSNQEIKVIIKDISSTGIAFVSEKNFEVGSEVLVSFIDTTNHTKFKLNAKIVRKEKMQRESTIYGCSLVQYSDSVSKYVNEKQRERIRLTKH